jgi:hypothetical protein
VEHVVFFPAPDGSPAFRRVASLDEAVRLVEHLRNVEGVSSVSVHALAEVPLAFRAYYRVEVPAEAHVPAQPVESPVEPVLAVAPVAEPVAVEPVAVEPEHEAPALALVEDAPAEEPVLVSSNGHSPTAPASLGFFA